MENCPTCERELKRIEDYPLVYIVKVKRKEISPRLVFPYFDQTVFVDAEKNSSNPKPPQEVVDFYQDKTHTSKFELNGWVWRLANREQQYYQRQQRDQKEIICTQVNPYLDTLESFVGKEVARAEFIPPFEHGGCFKFAFEIPQTAYHLLFLEDTKSKGSTRTVNLVIYGEGENVEEYGGPTLRNLATIAKIEYEGKLRKLE